jgi:hypothetical protein
MKRDPARDGCRNPHHLRLAFGQAKYTRRDQTRSFWRGRGGLLTARNWVGTPAEGHRRPVATKVSMSNSKRVMQETRWTRRAVRGPGTSETSLRVLPMAAARVQWCLHSPANSIPNLNFRFKDLEELTGVLFINLAQLSTFDPRSFGVPRSIAGRPTTWGTCVAKGRALHTRYESTRRHWTRL